MNVMAKTTTAWGRRKRHFEELSDAEILAVAISNEDEAARAYTEFAESLQNDYPDSARMFTDMALEETEHRHRLIDLFRIKFGETIPAIRAEDVRGVAQERPAGLVKALGAEAMRRQARQMEANASRFYHQAASRTTDATIRQQF